MKNKGNNSFKRTFTFLGANSIIMGSRPRSTPQFKTCYGSLVTPICTQQIQYTMRSLDVDRRPANLLHTALRTPHSSAWTRTHLHCSSRLSTTACAPSGFCMSSLPTGTAIGMAVHGPSLFPLPCPLPARLFVSCRSWHTLNLRVVIHHLAYGTIQSATFLDTISTLNGNLSM